MNKLTEESGGSLMEAEKHTTGFARWLYALVRKIPAGKVATYGQLALMLGMPRGARAVGTCLNRCADPSVPCHRVVDRLGGTKPVFDDYAPGTQRALLESEGVSFLPDGRVDLSLSEWNGKF